MREAELAEREREIDTLRRTMLVGSRDQAKETVFYDSPDVTFSEGLRVLAARSITNPNAS